MPNGHWLVSGVVTCENQTVTVKNLTVATGASLTLRNMTVIFDASFDATASTGHLLDACRDGSRLEIYDSVIRAKSPHKRPVAQVCGTTTMIFVNSTLEDFRAFGITESFDTFSAIRGDVLIQDSRFLDVSNGIYVTQDRVQIRGSFFHLGRYPSGDEGFAGHAIYTRNAPVIENNTFVNWRIAIQLESNSARPTIANNTITANRVGITQVPGATRDQEVHFNDIFFNFGNSGRPRDAYFHGDATRNWWALDSLSDEHFLPCMAPDPSCADDLNRVNFAYRPWLQQPVHPERLPVAVVSGLPAAIREDSSAALSASLSQPSEAFGFPLTRYEWDFGDGARGSGVNVAHVYPQPGTYTVRLTVFDFYNLTREWTGTLRVLSASTAPRVANLTLQPASPNGGEALRAVARIEDSDNDSVSVEYAWSLNGVVESSLWNETVPGALVHAGDVWRVKVTPHDSVGTGASVEREVRVNPAPSPPPTPTPPPSSSAPPGPTPDYSYSYPVWTPPPTPTPDLPTPIPGVSPTPEGLASPEAHSPGDATPGGKASGTDWGVSLAAMAAVVLAWRRRGRPS